MKFVRGQIVCEESFGRIFERELHFIEAEVLRLARSFRHEFS
jgi:hypothetical protein